jgi:hypothetical protein
MEIFQQSTQKSESMKSTLGVKATNTLHRLNYLIELVYNSKKMGSSKHFIQNQFLKKFGKELSNKNFYRYVERIEFLSVNNSWVHIEEHNMDKVDTYVSEFLPETFYQVHPRLAA